MPWDPSFVLVAWKDEAQWLVMVKEGPSGKQGLSRSWIEQDDEVSFAASRPRGD